MEADLKAALLTAYARLLRPLVQILLRNGVSYSEFADTAKRVFVTTAATRIEKSGAAVSAAQIAIQTGLSQRETQEVLDGAGEAPVNTNLAWITYPVFTASNLAFCKINLVIYPVKYLLLHT